MSYYVVILSLQSLFLSNKRGPDIGHHNHYVQDVFTIPFNIRRLLKSMDILMVYYMIIPSLQKQFLNNKRSPTLGAIIVMYVNYLLVQFISRLLWTISLYRLFHQQQNDLLQIYFSTTNWRLQQQTDCVKVYVYFKKTQCTV